MVVTQTVSGLDGVIQLLTESIGWLQEHAAIGKELQVYRSSGVLLHGPAGCGKTMLVQEIAARLKASLHTVVASSIFDAVTGSSEERLRNVFKMAQREAETKPVILFLDEVDALCPKRMSSEEHEKRVVAQLLTLLDGACQHTGTGRQIYLMAASNRIEAIDPALRRAGRLDREIYIPLPTKEAREEILTLHTATMPLAPSCDLSNLAAASHGYSSSDLVAWCREASIAAIDRRLRSDNDILEMEHDVITQADFLSALNRVNPSMLRSSGERLEVTWDDIGGMNAVKERLIKGVVWPIQHSGALHRLGLDPPQGIIIEGPPGCAKTTLVKAAISASGASCQVLTPAQLHSAYVGEGEAVLRAAFSTARCTAPSIIFIDELDTLAGSREGQEGKHVGSTQLLTSLLTEIDGLENAKGVMVMAATNRPEAIDPALMRPGRFDVNLSVSKPDADGRLAILQVYCQQYKLASDVDLKDISLKMSGFSGADIECVCREAGIAALHKQLMVELPLASCSATINASVFEEALSSYQL